MNEKDLNKALTDINPEFVLEAAPDIDRSKTVPFRRRRVFKAASAAAAACLLLAVGIGAFNSRRLGKSNTAPSSAAEEFADAAAEAEEYADAGVQEFADTGAEKAAGNAAMENGADMEEAAEALYYEEPAREYETETETETENVMETETETDIRS